ncbi:hypothetical protein NUW54_g10366 [Trametes sanguinea]|uniref:Uncharacterized protein n=1 Tax=Trametes sanguinea TaxID=158606 RepID=A0ACC1P2M7_9APHY|nr:hypothetical protein NUW54_g10366 [Trametes sanguinea]
MGAYSRSHTTPSALASTSVTANHHGYANLKSLRTPLGYSARVLSGIAELILSLSALSLGHALQAPVLALILCEYHDRINNLLISLPFFWVTAKYKTSTAHGFRDRPPPLQQPSLLLRKNLPTPACMKYAAASLLFAASVAYAQQGEWQQCGGIGWTGETTCVAGTVCTAYNDYYSQCTPAPATSTLPRLGGVNTAGYDFSVGTDGSFTGTGVSPPPAQFTHFANEGANLFRIPFAHDPYRWRSHQRDVLRHLRQDRSGRIELWFGDFRHRRLGKNVLQQRLHQD